MTALPRSLNQQGRVKVRWQRWQQHQRAVVMRRCGGRCERTMG
jgi:hypothetical protein